MAPIEDDIITLIKGCQKNDRKAQEQVYSRFYGAMITLCLRYTKNEEDAVEVLNNGFLKVFTKIDRYDPAKGSFYTWIRTVVVNSAIDFIRSKRLSAEVMAPLNGEEAPIENEAIQKLAADELLTMIRSLPPTTQLVFNLYVLEGFDHKEIASLLGISDGTSRWHLSEARRILKQHIQLHPLHE